MPFEVFRRHQKKIIAGLAIMAMFLFTVGDVLTMIQGNADYGKELVKDAKGQPISLYGGQPLRYRDLERIRTDRAAANQMVYNLQMLNRPNQMPNNEPFGGYTDGELVNALLLEHEADRLGIPVSRDAAKLYLRDVVKSTSRQFADARRMSQLTHMSNEQIIDAIARQRRNNQVFETLGMPILTPLDVFEGYRDLQERVQVNTVPFSAADFLKGVGEPTDTVLQNFFEKYKNVLPNPNSPTPGFKIPRKLALAVLTVDYPALQKRYEDEVLAREADLRAQFATRRTEFLEQNRERMSQGEQYKLPPNELPLDLFSQPVTRAEVNAKLPKSQQSLAKTPADEGLPFWFHDVKSLIATDLAKDKANAAMRSVSDVYENQIMQPLINGYEEAINQLEIQLEDKGVDLAKNPVGNPEPDTLLKDGLKDALAEILGKLGLDAKAAESTEQTIRQAMLQVSKTQPDAVLTLSPALSRLQIKEFGAIESAVEGMDYPDLFNLSSARKFEEVAFDPKFPLFSQMTLADNAGKKYVIWKIADRPTRVPTFDEARTVVLEAWKLEQAAALAKKAAEDFAALVRKENGDMRKAAGDKNVITTAALPKLQAQPFDPTNFQSPSIPRPSELIDFDNPGDKLRKALFALKPGEVAVAPNQPANRFYVMSLHSRQPVTVNDFLSPLNERTSSEVSRNASYDLLRGKYRDFMNGLRKQAGVDPRWMSKSEAERIKEMGIDPETVNVEADADAEA